MGELNVVVQPGVERRKREGEQDKVIRSKRRETRERQRETERERERERKQETENIGNVYESEGTNQRAKRHSWC